MIFTNKELLRQDIKQIFGLMVPIWLTLLVAATMHSISIILAGHVSTSDVAGVSVGANIWIPLYTGISGIIQASSTIFANLIGAKRKQDLPSALRHSLYLGIIGGVLLVILANTVIFHIDKVLTLEPKVHRLAKDYVFALSFGAIPLYIAVSLRQFVEAMNSARTVTLVILTALPVDFLVSYTLVFGKFGIPAMGGVGAGYGAATSATVMAGLLIYIVTKMDKFANFNLWQHIVFDFKRIKEQLHIGIPMGLGILFEVGMFNMLSLMIVKFGSVVVAANQAALTATTFFFMMLLAMSMSLNIVVGYKVGAKDYAAAQRLGNTGLVMTMLMSMLTIVLVYFCRDLLAMLFNSDRQIQSIIVMYLTYVMFYQLADSILTAGQGILRAYRDVKAAFCIVVFVFWGLCLPAGYIADHYFGRGITSYWDGLVCGMILGAGIMLARLSYLRRKYRTIAVVNLQ